MMKNLILAALLGLSTLGNSFALEAEFGTGYKYDTIGFYGKVGVLKIESFSLKRQTTLVSPSLINSDKTEELNIILQPDISVAKKGKVTLSIAPALGLSHQQTEITEQKIDNNSCKVVDSNTILPSSCFAYKTKNTVELYKGLGTKLGYELEKGVDFNLRLDASKIGNQKIEKQVSVGFTIDF